MTSCNSHVWFLILCETIYVIVRESKAVGTELTYQINTKNTNQVKYKQTKNTKDTMGIQTDMDNLL